MNDAPGYDAPMGGAPKYAAPLTEPSDNDIALAVEELSGHLVEGLSLDKIMDIVNGRLVGIPNAPQPIVPQLRGYVSQGIREHGYDVGFQMDVKGEYMGTRAPDFQGYIDDQEFEEPQSLRASVYGALMLLLEDIRQADDQG